MRPAINVGDRLGDFAYYAITQLAAARVYVDAFFHADGRRDPVLLQTALKDPRRALVGPLERTLFGRVHGYQVHKTVQSVEQSTEFLGLLDRIVLLFQQDVLEEDPAIRFVSVLVAAPDQLLDRVPLVDRHGL